MAESDLFVRISGIIWLSIRLSPPAGSLKSAVLGGLHTAEANNGSGQHAAGAANRCHAITEMLDLANWQASCLAFAWQILEAKKVLLSIVDVLVLPDNTTLTSLLLTIKDFYIRA